MHARRTVAEAGVSRADELREAGRAAPRVCSCDLNKHRIDWDKWPNQIDQHSDIVAPEATATPTDLRDAKSVDAAELTVFPNPGVGIVWTDAARISPGVDRDHAVGERRRNVHGAAVHADDEVCDTNEPDQLQ